MEIVKFWFWYVVSFFNSDYSGKAFTAEIQARIEWNQFKEAIFSIPPEGYLTMLLGLAVVYAVGSLVDSKIKASLC